MSRPLIQSAVNFSEGRRSDVIQAILRAARSSGGAKIADWSADVDHNRMVATFLGDSNEVARAVLASSMAAIDRIDLRAHTGVHPRIGAIDVVPFTPIRDTDMAECVELSEVVGEALGTCGVPVYLYECSSRERNRTSLPALRRGGFEGLAGRILDGERAPDYGPAMVHPTAGASVVGARPALVAFNVNLATSDVGVAKRIAATIRTQREVRPGLAGVRAMGVFLSSRGTAQVSMNVTRVGVITLADLLDLVRREAAKESVEPYETEIVGLVPRSALGGASCAELLWNDSRESQILEHWTN